MLMFQNLVSRIMRYQYKQILIKKYFSVILFANTLVFSGIAILLNIVSIRMVRIRKLSSPPMVVRNTLSGLVGTVLCLGTSQVSILTIVN